ncbi:pilus (MSHA type) biogenesis protein MshL [Immundisolibacter sp.]|jgi:general secretion pathway protein D
MSLPQNDKGCVAMHTNECAGGRRGLLRCRGAALLFAAVSSGCASYPPPLPVSQNHIHAESQTKASGIPEPVRADVFVPPPKASVKPQTYSVVVNEVPVKELLFALARDSKLNVDIHPAIQGLVTMNAVNEPLDSILDRLSRQVSLRYKIEGDTLSITPDSPYMQTYKVDYVNLSRNSSSNIGVTTQIASVGTSSATGGAVLSGGAAGNNSVTRVESKSDNNFWEILGENLRHILNATRTVATSAEERAERGELMRAEREERLRQAEAVARAGSGAPALYASAFSNQKTTGIADTKEYVVVNSVTGSVSVLGTQKQHKLVKEYLDNVVNASRRQVLIEATIVEVVLNDQYRAGVDWTKIASTGAATQSMLGGRLGTAPFFTLTYANPNSIIGNISATVSLLEQFGDTKVLSSPKIMAINNQTAVLKVVDNIVYFSVSVVPGQISNGVIAPTTYTSEPHTVPVGVVMSVTPQIDESGMVSLTVRPTISRVVSYKNDPNPDLARVNITNPVPEIQVRELESVLQVKTGQTIIMGGLMQDDVSKKRDGIPWISRIPGLGDAFSYRDDNARKTELVIFLRPTVINQTSLDSSELRAYRQYLPADARVPVAQP